MPPTSPATRLYSAHPITTRQSSATAGLAQFVQLRDPNARPLAERSVPNPRKLNASRHDRPRRSASLLLARGRHAICRVADQGIARHNHACRHSLRAPHAPTNSARDDDGSGVDGARHRRGHGSLYAGRPGAAANDAGEGPARDRPGKDERRFLWRHAWRRYRALVPHVPRPARPQSGVRRHVQPFRRGHAPRHR